MRNGCQWCALLLLLLSGCGGSPGGGSPPSSAERAGAQVAAESAAAGTPASPAPAPDSGTRAGPPGLVPDQLSATAARRFLAAHPEALVLDVRNPDEWNDDLGHIENARLIPLPELATREGEIAAWKEKPIVVVCRAGGRSREATGMLRAAGFSQAMNLEGGMLAWRSSEKVAGQH